MQFQGVHLSPLGFAACQSKKCTNQANSGSPTDFTEFTEASAGDELPQISQICTEAANFSWCTCLKCTNQANNGSPTDCTDLHRS